MKNIEILIGSPRRKGNTFILADMLAKSLKEKECNTTLTFLYDYEIDPCIDCRACKQNDLECTLADDMYKIYEKIEKCDFLVVGTPIYWYNPTAKTKLFIDRLRPYFVNKKLNSKKMALLLPAGSGAGDCDLTIETFRRICSSLGIEYIGEVISESYNEGDVLNDAAAASMINLLAANIAGVLKA